MKKYINKLLDPNISKKEEDQIFEELLKKKYDNELRTKWQEKLTKDHGISREHSSLHRKTSSGKYLKLILAAAASIALIVTLQLFNVTSNNVSELAQQYLDDQEILHPGASKGTAEESNDRTLAIQAFNQKEYNRSILLFSTLSKASDEDRYYLGLSYLLNKQYKEAIQEFETTKIKSNRFSQEINWYLSLTYLLNQQNNKAKKVLKSIKTNDWKYTKAVELLKKL